MAKTSNISEVEWGRMKQKMEQQSDDIKEIKCDVKEIKILFNKLPETYITRNEYNEDRDKQDLANNKKQDKGWDIKKMVASTVISAVITSSLILLIYGFKTWLG